MCAAAASLVVLAHAEGDEHELDLDKRHVFAPRVGKHKRAYILRMGKRSEPGVEAAAVDDDDEGLDLDKRARILRMGKRARILRMGWARSSVRLRSEHGPVLWYTWTDRIEKLECLAYE